MRHRRETRAELLASTGGLIADTRTQAQPVGSALELAAVKARLLAGLTGIVAQFVKKDRPLKTHVIGLEQQARWFGELNYFTTNLTYSNWEARIDVAAQYLTGSHNGYGASARFVLDNYRSMKAKVKIVNYDTAPTLVKYIFAPHFGVTGDYQHLNHGGVIS